MTMINLFFSYSHRDEDLRNELEIHLTSLKRQGKISTWHDRRIGAGNEFDRSISDNLESADIILLLVSPYFIASDYCYEVEMKRSLEKHEKDEAIVIPVILEPCDWHDLPFGKILAATKDGKAISKFPNIHDGFLEVTKAVKDAAKRISPCGKDKELIFDDNSHVKPQITTPNIRSSNLRIQKTFSDFDKDNFLIEAFDYMAKYFEGSLSELKERNPGIETKYRKIDSNTFSATIYKEGSEVNSCSIWMDDKSTFTSGILYSTSGHGNGYNESISVEDDGYSMYLKPLGMAFSQQEEKDQLSFEGGSEYYWSMFIEYLQ
jgi:hypothetical protein